MRATGRAVRVAINSCISVLTSYIYDNRDIVSDVSVEDRGRPEVAKLLLAGLHMISSSVLVRLLSVVHSMGVSVMKDVEVGGGFRLAL